MRLLIPFFLALVGTSAFAADEDRCGYLLVLTVTREVQGYLENSTDPDAKNFMLQKLNFAVHEAGEKKHEYLGHIQGWNQHKFSINGFFHFRLEIDPAHLIAYNAQLPDSMPAKLFQLIASPQLGVTNSYSFVAYMSGVPTTTSFDADKWVIHETPDRGDIYVGQVVGLGDVHGAPTHFGVFLGGGYFLSYLENGVIALDMRSMMRRAKSTKIQLLVPRREGAELKIAEDNYKPFFSRSEYQRWWSIQLHERLAHAHSGSSATAGQVFAREIIANTPHGKISKKLGYSAVSENLVLPPRLHDFISAYDAVIDKEIGRGVLTEKDVFRFGRAFRDWRGNYLFLGWWDFPPPGYYEIDPNRIPPTAIGMMLNQGFMPISLGRGFHDSRHFEAFAQFPVSYMKPLRAFIRQLGTDYRLPRRERSLRVFWALEVLSLVPKSRWPKLKALLSPPAQVNIRTLVTVDDVKRYYEDTSFNEVVEPRARALLAALPHLIDNYGGGPRDPSLDWMSSDQGARENPKGMADRLALLLDHFRDQRNDVEDPNEKWLSKANNDSLELTIRHELARLEVALRESTRIGPTEFIQQLAEPVTDPEGSLYRMFVLSGVSAKLDGLFSDDENLGDSLKRCLAK